MVVSRCHRGAGRGREGRVGARRGKEGGRCGERGGGGLHGCLPLP